MNDNLNKFIRKHLLDLVPYESARNIMNESQSTDINLDANENPYGISCDYTTMNLLSSRLNFFYLRYF